MKHERVEAPTTSPAIQSKQKQTASAINFDDKTHRLQKMFGQCFSTWSGQDV